MSELINQLHTLLGDSGLLTDDASCTLYAQDVLTKSYPALAVAQPDNTEQLSACVKMAVDAGVDVIPRGGGMSYTSGYVPKNADSLIIDLRRMDRILEINTEDMYVTVEAGCTWEKLYKQLNEIGYRTPFWGTLSGRFATIGGGVSQNAIFWGSSKYGSVAESVLSISVVLADGRLLKTGSAARQNSSPWFRNFGPDLSGIFLGDCGALGFKASITLKIIPNEDARRGLSFASETGEAMLAFTSEVSRQQLVSELCGFDPFLQSQRLKRESLGKDVQALAGVMKSAGGIGKALKAGAKIAMAGRGYMKDVKFSIHALIEETYEEVATLKEKAIRELAEKHGLREIENSIPTLMRSNPFGPVNSMIGPEAERWAPVHGIVPNSKTVEVFQAIETLFEKHHANINQYTIGCGYLFTAVANSSCVIEPVFFWPDELTEIHRHAVEDAHLNSLEEYPSNPEARAAVMSIRKDLIDIFSSFGCAHFQIGKAYPYRDTLIPEATQLLEAIKNHVDPNHHVNPGALGLDK